MVTPWEIYWVLQLDSISNSLVALSVILLLGSFISILAAALFSSLGYDDDDKKRTRVCAKLAFRVTVFVTAPAWILATFLPSTRTAAAMIIAPKIINSPTVQHEAGDLYKLAKQALENAVAPKKDK